MICPDCKDLEEDRAACAVCHGVGELCDYCGTPVNECDSQCESHPDNPGNLTPAVGQSVASIMSIYLALSTYTGGALAAFMVQDIARDREAAIRLLREFKSLVDDTGGLIHSDELAGTLVPVADPTWSDLAEYYTRVCKYLGVSPRIQEED